MAPFFILRSLPDKRSPVVSGCFFFASTISRRSDSAAIMPIYSLPTLEYRFQRLDVKCLDLPDDLVRFLHDNGVGQDACIDNLRTWGLPQPLPVWQSGATRFQLLAGYPYLPALRSLGIKTVQCQILPPDTAVFNRYALQIRHSLSTLPSSPVLQAHLLQQAQKTLAEDEALRLLAAMGHKPQRYKLQELLALLQLDPTVLLAMHQGILSVKAGKHLALLTPDDQRSLVEVINTYRPGGSKQQKLVEMTVELALRHNKPVRDIVRDWVGGQTDQHNRPQQLQHLLQTLQEQVAPRNTEAEKDFHKLVQALQPPEQVSLEHSPSFEDDSVTVRLYFSTSEQLRAQWQTIQTLAR